MNCQFMEIDCSETMFHDGTWQATVTIHNSKIHMIGGGFYSTGHVHSSHIDIDNLFIQTNQLTTGDNTGLFEFAFADIVNMIATTVIYNYDASINCYFEGLRSNSDINADSTEYECKNPMIFMNNYGEVNIDNMTVDIIIDYGNITQEYDTEYHYVQYILDGEYGWITNEGIMTISNSEFYDTISRKLIYNANNLTFFNVNVTQANIEAFDPNLLRSDVIIYSRGSESNVYVENGNFAGSFIGIQINSGSCTIIDSLFQRMSRSIQFVSVNGIVVRDSEFMQVGQYNGVFSDSSFTKTYITAPIQIWYSNDIILTNNTMFGFDPKALVFFRSSSSILFADNDINLDASDLYYNISDQNIHSMDRPVLYYSGCSNTQSIGNYFYHDPDKFVLPDGAIGHRYGSDVNCLAGNTFINFALDAYRTNVTSCFRKELIDCVDNSSLNCQNGFYGVIDPSLFGNETNILINDAGDDIMILSAVQSNIALDNINIKILNSPSINDSIILSGSQGSILLIDSYIDDGFDVSYNNDSCNMLQNTRLSSDENYISSLSLDCNISVSDSVNLVDSIMSPVTSYVDHLNPIQFEFFANSSFYYPGQLLEFKHNIYDKHGTKLKLKYSSLSVIQVYNTDFTSKFTIYDDTSCPRCDEGMLVNTISLKENLNEAMAFQIGFEKDEFVLKNVELQLIVSGCPIMHGPSSNNYTCIECNTGYFNIDENNIRQCHSCDLENNAVINCIAGDILVSQNHWMSIENNEIISGLCPSGYCCSKSQCSFINDKESLCSLNRDYQVPLCGACKDGYSESANSNVCIICDRNHWEYMLLPLFLAFLFSLSLMASNMEQTVESPKGKEASTMWKRILKSEKFKVFIKIALLRNIIYYQQGIDQILSSSAISVLLTSFTSIFNLSIISVTSKNSDDDDDTSSSWCFIKGMTGKQKILVDLLMVFMIFIIIMTFYVFSTCIFKKALKIKTREVNFKKTFVAGFLLIIGKILDVLFRLLNCESIGEDSVHFYFGYENCYGTTWIMALISLLIIIILFVIQYIAIGRMPEEQRNDPSSATYSLVNRYKSEYYYWEFVLFIRRVIIALFAVSVNEISAKFLFLGIMICFAYIQVISNPFIIEEANKFEFILLMATLFITAAEIASALDYTFVNLMVSFLIILPIPLLFWYIYKLYKSQFDIEFKSKKDDNIINPDDDDNKDGVEMTSVQAIVEDKDESDGEITGDQNKAKSSRLNTNDNENHDESENIESPISYNSPKSMEMVFSDSQV